MANSWQHIAYSISCSKAETDLLQDGGKIKIEKTMDNHGPRNIPISYYLPVAPTLSLVFTFTLNKLLPEVHANGDVSVLPVHLGDAEDVPVH
jgi:hypothetical protein